MILTLHVQKDKTEMAGTGMIGRTEWDANRKSTEANADEEMREVRR
jgi:hypothetical protein